MGQVLDEADQLLQMDQQKTLGEIYKRLPQQGVGDLRLQVRRGDAVVANSRSTDARQLHRVEQSGEQKATTATIVPLFVAVPRGSAFPTSCDVAIYSSIFAALQQPQSSWTPELLPRYLLSLDVSQPPSRPSSDNPPTHRRDNEKQVCFFSATLHSPEIARLAESICDRPTWVDLKGRDTVPQTVHHVVVRVDPDVETKVTEEVLAKAKAKVLQQQPRTDGAAVGAGSEGREEERAERLKRMKPLVREVHACM